MGIYFLRILRNEYFEGNFVYIAYKKIRITLKLSLLLLRHLAIYLASILLFYFVCRFLLININSLINVLKILDSTPTFVCVYLCVCLSACCLPISLPLSIYPSLFLSVCLFICRCLCVRLFLCLIYSPNSQSSRPSTYLFI